MMTVGVSYRNIRKIRIEDLYMFSTLLFTFTFHQQGPRQSARSLEYCAIRQLYASFTTARWAEENRSIGSFHQGTVQTHDNIHELHGRTDSIYERKRIGWLGCFLRPLAIFSLASSPCRTHTCWWDQAKYLIHSLLLSTIAASKLCG